MGNYKKFKYLLLAGLVIAPAAIATPIILVQKLDKKYLLFDNKVFSSTRALDNYLHQNKKDISSLKMNAKSFYFDNQVFNTSQQFYEYLANKFPTEEKLTNKIPGNYTINGAGELSKQVLLNNNDKALKVYKGKNGLAYLNRKEALDTFINYKKIYTIEGQEFSTPSEIKDYLTNKTLKKLNETDQKTLVYKNGGLMQTEVEIKSWLRKNIKNGFEYQGRIFSDYNYKEFLDYFQHLDSNIIDENVATILNADKSGYWVNLDDNSVNGYFIGPKYVETNAAFSTAKIKEEFRTIDSFTPNLFSGLVALSFLNETVSLDYNSKIDKEVVKWNDGFKKYVTNLNENKIISDSLFADLNSILLDDNLTQISQIVKDSTANLGQIGGNELNDFHRLLVVMKRIMVPTRIYAGLNPEAIEKVLKQLLVEILSYKHSSSSEEETNENFIFNLAGSFNGQKLEDLISLFLNPADFYQANESKEFALATIKKVDQVIGQIINGVSTPGEINEKFDKLKNKYQDKKQDEKQLKQQREDANKAAQDKLAKNQEHILKKIGIEAIKENSNSSFGLATVGLGGLIKWISFGWELLNTFSFISIKTLEYKIDEYQSIYYVAPTWKLPLFNVEGNVTVPDIEITTLSQSPLDYMLPPKPEGDGKVTEIYELEGKYYLEKENAIEELRSKIYLNPEKYIPCKKIFTSIYENDEGHQLPDNLVNAKIIKKAGDEDKPNAMQYGDYLKAIDEEKEKYVKQLFEKYFEPNKQYYYFVDGLGNYFGTKTEAIASVEANLKNNNFEEQVSYSYVTRSGKKFIAKTEADIIDFIQKNELIESKTVMSTELIKTSIYDQVSDYSNIYFSVFELNYYGDKKYFASELQVWTYLMAHLDYQINHYEYSNQTFKYQDYQFKSNEEFMSWVELNTQIINDFETKGKEIIYD